MARLRNAGFFLITLVVFFQAAQTALANNPDEIGLGARAQGLAGAMTAGPPGWESSYYNPGALPFVDQTKIYWGMSFTDIDVNFDSPIPSANRDAEDIGDFSGMTMGIAVPYWTGWWTPEESDDPKKKGQKPTQFTCPTCNNDTGPTATTCSNCGTNLAPVVQREAVYGPQITFGLGFFVPDGLIAIKLEPETNPRWVPYEARLEKMGINASIGFEINDTLGVGVGVQFLADSFTELNLNLTAPATQVTVNQELTGDFAPQVGVYWEATEEIALGLTYRGELSIKVDSITSTTVAGVPIDTTVVEAITSFSPQQIALGGSWQATEELLVLGDITWMNWARWAGSAPRIFSGIGDNIPPSPNIHNILIPRLAVEYEPEALEGWAFRTGIMIRPPTITNGANSSSLNYLDSWKYMFSLGTGVELWGGGDNIPPMRLDMAFQAHIHDDIRVSKQNPGDLPTNYESSLTILHFAAGVTLDW